VSDVLADLAHLTIILTGIILVAARWRWIKSETVDTWGENANMRRRTKIRRKREAQRRAAATAAAVMLSEPLPGDPPLPPDPPKLPQPETLVLYKMADGSLIDGFQWVTELEWFDQRDREVRLIKRTFTLVSEEILVLPDPHPIEEDEDG